MSSSQLENLSQQPDKISWFQSQLANWSLQNWREFPWRQTTNPYSIFIAESLLQKTDAAKVLPIYETFLANAF